MCDVFPTLVLFDTPVVLEVVVDSSVAAHVLIPTGCFDPGLPPLRSFLFGHSWCAG